MKKSITLLASLALVVMLSFGASAAVSLNADQLVVEQLDGDPKKKKAKKAKKAKKNKVKKEKAPKEKAMKDKANKAKAKKADSAED